MNLRLVTMIERMLEAEREWEDDPFTMPATPEAIQRVAEWFREHHHQDLPHQLSEFWGTANGMAMEGYRLLAAEDWEGITGIIDFNELYIEEFPEYFFLGTCDDISMYAYLPETRKYRILEMFAFEHYDAEFDTFDELAENVLHRAMRRAKLL